MGSSETRRTGLGRLSTGAALGLSGALVGLVVPVAFVELAHFGISEFFQFNGLFFESLSAMLMAGAVLLLLSFLTYRRAFAALRPEGGAFPIASAFCLAGTIGFLLLLIAAIVVFGSSDALARCVSGRPTGALTCLRGNSPLGGATAVLGFWFGWVGGLGLVLGFGASAGRFREPGFYGGAGLYALLLIVVVGPFLALVYTLPDVTDLLLLAPMLFLLAPAFVAVAARRAYAAETNR